jgi:hypothetical protein
LNDCYTVEALLEKSINVWQTPTLYRVVNKAKQAFHLQTLPKREIGFYLKSELLQEELCLEKLKEEKFNVQHIVEKIETPDHLLTVKTFANSGTLCDFIKNRNISQ